jgi:hypothetical protein
MWKENKESTDRKEQKAFGLFCWCAEKNIYFFKEFSSDIL